MNQNLKNFIKSIPLLSKIGYSYIELKEKKMMKKYKKYQVNPFKIFFAVNEGHYQDSCKYIAEKLHKDYPKFDLVWSCKNIFNSDEFPNYVRCVSEGSTDYYYELSTASVWVFNYLIPQGTEKKHNQLYIQVWHGDKPIKKIGEDAAKSSNSYKYKNSGRKFVENELCDYFMTGCKYFIPILEKAFMYKNNILTTGLPRNDCLLNIHLETVQTVKNKLKLNDDVKVLLYAPTHRDHNLDLQSVNSNIDLDTILSVLSKKYGSSWICLKRGHAGSELKMCSSQRSENILDVTKYSDMSELLCIADMLITDYSSCAGDFALTGRPVILYQDDIETYISKDRPLEFSRQDSPFLTAYNMDELIGIISNLTPKVVEENDKNILEYYQSTQTDHSTEDVCNIIFNHIQHFFN